MTDDDVLDLFDRIKVRWPNWKAPDNLELGVEVYLEDLEGFDYEAVKAAYKKFRGERFAPTLSEILETLEPSTIGEPWMERRSGSMGCFEPDPSRPRTLAEFQARAEAAGLLSEPDPT